MVGHAIYPRLGPRRASLEPKTYALLRELGFRGVAITDSLGILRRPLRALLGEARLARGRRSRPDDERRRRAQDGRGARAARQGGRARREARQGAAVPAVAGDWHRDGDGRLDRSSPCRGARGERGALPAPRQRCSSRACRARRRRCRGARRRRGTRPAPAGRPRRRARARGRSPPARPRRSGATIRSTGPRRRLRLRDGGFGRSRRAGSAGARSRPSTEVATTWSTCLPGFARFALQAKRNGARESTSRLWPSTRKTIARRLRAPRPDAQLHRAAHLRPRPRAGARERERLVVDDDRRSGDVVAARAGDPVHLEHVPAVAELRRVQAAAAGEGEGRAPVDPDDAAVDRELDARDAAGRLRPPRDDAAQRPRRELRASRSASRSPRSGGRAGGSGSSSSAAPDRCGATSRRGRRRAPARRRGR